MTKSITVIIFKNDKLINLFFKWWYWSFYVFIYNNNYRCNSTDWFPMNIKSSFEDIPQSYLLVRLCITFELFKLSYKTQCEQFILLYYKIVVLIKINSLFGFFYLKYFKKLYSN